MPPEAAPLLGMVGFTIHRMQGGRAGDYHDHEDLEQVYYFTSGRGKMKLDDEIYEVRDGDAVHIPPKVKASTDKRLRRLDRTSAGNSPSPLVAVLPQNVLQRFARPVACVGACYGHLRVWTTADSCLASIEAARRRSHGHSHTRAAPCAGHSDCMLARPANETCYTNADSTGRGRASRRS